MSLTRLTPRQNEVILLLKKGWYILHAPQLTPSYRLTQCRPVWRQRPVHTLAIVSLINSGIIGITGIHGPQARLDLTEKELKL